MNGGLSRGDANYLLTDRYTTPVVGVIGTGECLWDCLIVGVEDSGVLNVGVPLCCVGRSLELADSWTYAHCVGRPGLQGGDSSGFPVIDDEGAVVDGT